MFSLSRRFYLILLCSLCVSVSNAELRELDDKSLEDQKGKAGITIDIEYAVSIGEVAWKFSDNKDVSLRKQQNFNPEPPQPIEYVVPKHK